MDIKINYIPYDPELCEEHGTCDLCGQEGVFVRMIAASLVERFPEFAPFYERKICGECAYKISPEVRSRDKEEVIRALEAELALVEAVIVILERVGLFNR